MVAIMISWAIRREGCGGIEGFWEESLKIGRGNVLNKDTE